MSAGSSSLPVSCWETFILHISECSYSAPLSDGPVDPGPSGTALCISKWWEEPVSIGLDRLNLDAGDFVALSPDMTEAMLKPNPYQGTPSSQQHHEKRQQRPHLGLTTERACVKDSATGEVA